MRAVTLLTMALSPFILNAETQQAPSDSKCLSPFHAMHVDVRHTEAKGVGYKDGYTTLEGFGIYDHNPYFMPFIDLRGHVFNNGKFAGSMGLGERTVIPSINQVWGFYAYYDVRETEHNFTVHQLSPGLELLGRRMEYRINGYFPLGDDESHSYGRKFARFQGNRILVRDKKEYAMTGFDAEVGAHITQSTRHDFYAAASTYYFTADPFTTWGGKTRLLWRYQDYISLETSYSYDHLFKNVVQGTISFSYPFGSRLKREGQNCPNPHDLALSRAAFAPYRFEIPVVKRNARKKNAINPATGQPWKVWFVRNTSSSTGTYESPFPTLAQAQNASGPGDMIYVFAGDGTSNGMNTGIILQKGQTLLGSGTIQTLRTKKGRVHIPAFTKVAPTVTNTAGSVITLASGNEVAGMNIQVLAGNGFNCPTPVNGVNIHHNIVSGNIPHIGISLLGYGTLQVKNNLITSTDSTGVLSNVGVNIAVLDGNYARGIVTNNICSGHGYGMVVTTSPVPLFTTAFGDIRITENVISDFGMQGILIQQGMSSSNYIISSNFINDTQSTGIGTAAILTGLSNPFQSGTYFIDNNTIVATTPNFSPTGIGFATFGNPATSARVFIRNNTILVAANSGSNGVSITPSVPDSICATVTNNRIQLQISDSSSMFLGGAGVVNINDISNNLAPNFRIAPTGSGTVNFVLPGSCGP